MARTRRAAEVDIATEDAPADVRVAAELGCGQRALAAPLVAKERLLGVLVCFAPRSECSRDRTLTMLSALAGLLANSLATRPVIPEADGKYRSLFENALDGIFVADDDGRLIDANPRACELFRASGTSFCGGPYSISRPPKRPSKSSRSGVTTR